MKIVKLIFIFLFVTGPVHAEVEYSLNGDYRTFESGLSIMGQAAYNHLLWGEKKSPEDWQYGFFRAGGDIAVHGRGRGFIELYPVSIVRLSLQQSYTSRFYDVKPFDCKIFDCNGVVGRTTALAQVAGAAGAIVFTALYSQTAVTNEDGGKPLALESDNLALRNKGGNIESRVAFLGYKLGEHSLGVLALDSNVINLNSKNNAQYLVYRIKMPNEIQYSLLLGQYQSTFSDRGFSAIVGGEWSMGETLTIF